jgi:hypothetical protein
VAKSKVVQDAGALADRLKVAAKSARDISKAFRGVSVPSGSFNHGPEAWSMSGPLEWTHPVGPPGLVVLAGNTIECIASFEKEARDPFAALMPLLYGGVIFQTVPGLEDAPISLDPDRFNLELTDNAEEEFSFLESAIQLSAREPVAGLLPFPVEDRWIIPATVKTDWVMSRAFSFSMLAYNAGDPKTVPRAFIEATPGGVESRVELTLVGSSPPSAGEFYLDTAADGTSIETDDLSSTYSGRVLMLRYLPKRYLRVAPASLSTDEVNAINASVSLDEVIPARTYAT